jgi:ketosteroid isomerase-like protein
MVMIHAEDVMFSADAPLSPVCQVVLAFNQALNDGDLEAMTRLLTPDTVYENTYPPPDGERYAGLEQVRAFWEEFLRGSSQANFEIEELFGSEDRAVMRWRYTWENAAGEAGYIRGVDVYQIRDGKIAEKLSYVKG